MHIALKTTDMEACEKNTDCGMKSCFQQVIQLNNHSLKFQYKK